MVTPVKTLRQLEATAALKVVRFYMLIFLEEIMIIILLNDTVSTSHVI